MRIEINSGGLDSFFNGVSTFINTLANNSASNSLIKSIQKVADKTNSISGGVGTLSSALDFINTRKAIEEGRKNAVQAVHHKTNDFIQTAKDTDKAVARNMTAATEKFYRTNPWLRPPAPPTNWDRFWGGVKDTYQVCKDALVKWYTDHPIIAKIVIGTAAILAGLAITIATGGAALPFLLTAAKVVGAATAAGAVYGGASAAIRGESILSGIAEGAASGFMAGGIAVFGGAIFGQGMAGSVFASGFEGGLDSAFSGGSLGDVLNSIGQGMILGTITGGADMLKGAALPKAKISLDLGLDFAKELGGNWFGDVVLPKINMEAFTKQAMTPLILKPTLFKPTVNMFTPSLAA